VVDNVPRRRRKNLARRIDQVKKTVEEEPERYEWVNTEIPGFDKLFDKGIPKGKNILVAGGPGTGKTIFCLQALYNAAREGHDCLYITFEELPASLAEHMRKFGWDFRKIRGTKTRWVLAVEAGEKRGRVIITKQDPFEIAAAVEELHEKAARRPGMKMEVIPLTSTTSNPYMLVLDSISALESTFVGKPESYRIYIEQLFRFLEETGATTFLITETEEAPALFTKTGVEEFLADGVFVLYNFKLRDMRVRAVEVLKLRGAKHERKIVPFTIGDKGIEVFPTERIYDVESLK
jgi:KaiC/GvpD/RAD55 family RecA-like ATPase